ncbi:MAG: PEGA domain-containing protein [Gammaproteobacteria bacterium]|nr:PEGA domain-containing protein [Gammaproteobacteria bacterium]
MSATEQPPSESNTIQAVHYQPRTTVVERPARFSRAQWTLFTLAALAVLLLLFLFTARSVQLTFTPSADSITVSGGPAFEFGGVHLMLQTQYRVTAGADGYYPLDVLVDIASARNQSFTFDFVPLPGVVMLTSEPEGAYVSVDGRPLGMTPLADTLIDAGTRHLRFAHPRYQVLEIDVDIEGRNRPQQVSEALVPNWGDITFETEPPGAEILVDEVATGLLTPAVVEILAGEHEIQLRLDGHKSHRQRILVGAEEARTLPSVALQQADGLLSVRTSPARAGVTIDGQYQGESPVDIALQSGRSYRVQIFKVGFAPRQTRVNLTTGERRALNLSLERLTGMLVIQADPPQAELFVDGKALGSANQSVELPTRVHRLEIKLAGYAGYTTEITPRNGLTQELRIKLLTLAEARLAALQPTITTAAGQTLKLFDPSPIQLGASRREPGRRANETLRNVELEQLFYLGTQEVTNTQFKAFASGHDSGIYEEQRLNKDEQPVADISWADAARYCNWLSRQDGLKPFYLEEFGKIVGTNPTARGYRLPTEAEWAWTARHVEGSESLLRFPWGGALPPPDRHGNYADRAAAHLVGRIIFGYNDNHMVAAPVGTFAANSKGIDDLGGNVAEWIHDFYQHPVEAGTGPLGPVEGEYHVISGSSWMHGTTTDLRLSFRDYGADGRRDVGFRLARFAE